VSIESSNQVSTNGDIHYDSVVDMSGMVAMMNSLSEMNMSGSTTPNSTTPKNLCDDFTKDTASLTWFYLDISCESLGDYKARVRSTFLADKNPWVLVESGVIVFNPLWSKSLEESDISDEVGYSPVDGPDLGMVINWTFNLPYPIVYRDIGKKLDIDSLELNMLDKKIMKRKELFIVARADGKKPTIKELIRYKKLIRAQVLKAKKSGKYKDFDDMTGL
jgi:hypothetical protein